MTADLKKCPFCGATPHRGLTPVQHDQLHGDPFQRYRIWCPKGHASVEEVNEEQAVEAWNTRADWQPKDALQRYLKSKGATKLDPAIMDEYLREMNETAIPAIMASQREQSRRNADPSFRFKPLFGDLPKPEIGTTNRGFSIIEFEDANGEACSLQKSSLATDDCVWLGCKEIGLKHFIAYRGWEDVPTPHTQADHWVANNRMHLNREQAAMLASLLQRFAETGELDQLPSTRDLPKPAQESK